MCSTLFGSTSILTLTEGEVWLCAILSVVVVAVFILFYNKIFAVTFDENFAKATGTRANAYNLLIAVVIAVIIVLAMNLVGSLLISALVIFGTFCYETVQILPFGNDQCSSDVCVQCSRWNPDFHPGRNSGRINDRGC